jgi:hypothetical protein
MAGDAVDPRLGAALARLLLASHRMHPDDVPAEVAAAANLLGARDVVLLLSDLDQTSLRVYGSSLLTAADVDGPGAGEAYRTEQPVVEPAPGGGRRLWLPVLDSSERLGVLGLIDDGDVPLRDWLAFALLAGDLVHSKSNYGDTVVRTRRQGDVSVAAEMRWGLLPPLDFVCEDIAISGLVRPSYGIAGDAFDYAVTGREVSIAVIDAMGHGLEASRMANLAIGTYRNRRRAGEGPAESLAAMDDAIATSFGECKFVTAQAAVVDLDAGRLRLTNAGHPPPLLVRGGRAVELDCPPGRPVGLGARGLAESSSPLEPGDVVVFRTDGVADARSPAGEPYGVERLRARLCELVGAGERPPEVLRLVARDVLAHQAGRPGDDATLVLLRWRPST